MVHPEEVTYKHVPVLRIPQLCGEDLGHLPVGGKDREGDGEAVIRSPVHSVQVPDVKRRQRYRAGEGVGVEARILKVL
jgi:hypothetical protein